MLGLQRATNLSPSTAAAAADDDDIFSYGKPNPPIIQSNKPSGSVSRWVHNDTERLMIK